jgi:hypothetical protein
MKTLARSAGLNHNWNTAFESFNCLSLSTKLEKRGRPRFPFLVADAKFDRHVGDLMSSTLTKPKPRLTKARDSQRPEKFWVRKANPELDRAGTWLLENLATIRAEATSRANSR